MKLSSISLALAAAAALVIPANTAQAAVGVYNGIDGYPTRTIPSSCSGATRAGVQEFRTMITSQVGGGNGRAYDCTMIDGTSTWSYHADGRAWDWMMNAGNSNDFARAEEVIDWLIRADERGVEHANARRLGIGEIIWNHEIITLWSSSSDKSRRSYGGSNPHTDHVHFSFSVAAGAKQTSWWTANTKTPTWYLSNSLSSSTHTVTPFGYGFGASTALVGDWDGNGTDTVGIYNPRDRKFYLRNSLTGGVADVTTGSLGNFGDIPFAGDWNGDGADEVGLYRPRTRTFYFLSQGGATLRSPVSFGNVGDIPLVGNWDGTDTNDEVGVYRPSNRTFYLQIDNGGVVSNLLGNFDDIPLGGDWDCDGWEDIGLFRPSNHTFYLQTEDAIGNPVITSISYGASTSAPITGDWNGGCTATQGIAAIS